MKFRLDKTTDKLPQGCRLVYLIDGDSFTTEPDFTTFTSLLVDTLSLEIDVRGKIVGVWGYCPHLSWTKAELTPPNPELADIYAVSDEPFLRGVSVKILDRTDLPIYVDPASGWVHIVGEGIAASSISPLPGVILQLTDQDEFASLWLKPVRLPRYRYKRDRTPSTEGRLINVLRKPGSFRED